MFLLCLLAIAVAAAAHEYNVLPAGRATGCFGVGSIACPVPFYPNINCTKGGVAVPCEVIDVLINNPESGAWPGGGPMKYVTYGMLAIINKAQELLPGFHVKLTYQDDACNAAQSKSMFVSQMMEEPFRYVAFGGTSCSGTSMDIAVMTPFYRMPHVGWAPSASDLSDRTKFPDFFRTRVADSGSTGAWLELCRLANWSKVGVVYGETGRFGFHHSQLLSAIAAQGASSVEVLFDTQVMVLQADTKAVISLVKRHRSRILFVLAYSPKMRAIMCHGLRRGVKGLIMLGYGWHVANFPQDRSDPDMSGAGDPAFTCTQEEMHELFNKSYIGTNGDLWSSDMQQPLTCLPTMTPQSLKGWYDSVGITGSGYAADGAIYVHQITAGMDGLCTMLLMLQEMLVNRNRTLGELKARSPSIYQEIKQVLAATDFNGTSSKRVRFQNGDLDGGVSVFQTQEASLGAGPTLINIGKYEQGIVRLVQDVQWPNGGAGFANAPKDLFPSCSDGHVLVEGACRACSVGTFHSRAGDACVVCGAGTFGDLIAQTECKLCGAGRRSIDSLDPARRANCEDCLPGRYGAAAGLSSCLACPGGQFADSSRQTRCKGCGAGSFSMEANSSCTACGLGRYTDVGFSERCLPCAPGFHGPSTGLQLCMRCPSGKYSPTASAVGCTTCPGSLSTEFSGAVQEEQCGCPKFSYRSAKERGLCLPCPEGMSCPFGADEANLATAQGAYPEVLSGYMTRPSAPLAVYKCLLASHCPGGPPGKCAQFRDHEQVACGACEAGASETGTECVPCSGGDAWRFVLLAVVAVAAICAMTVMVNRDVLLVDRSAMACVVMLALVVSSIQTMGVFRNLSLEWFEPMASIVKLMSLLSFDLRIVRIGCVVGVNPVTSFVLRQCFAPLSVPAVLATILVKKMRKPATDVWIELVNSSGNVFQVLFISIMLSAVSPFISYRHPGSSGASVLSAPAILTFEGSEHATMATVGIIAVLLVPVPFACAAAYCTYKFPVWIHSSGRDGQFVLQACRFLFFKYRPERYYYGMIHLLRSTLICLVPVAIHNDPGMQICTLCMLLGLFTLVQQQMNPWHSYLANIADGLISLALMILLIAASQKTSSSIKVLGTLSFVVGCLVVLVVFAYSFYRRMVPRPYYRAFICHHKAHAAAQARLLKLHLQASKSGEDVFIDSDNLRDLDQLFDTVKCKVGHLVVYLTKETLSRPWCAGEIVVAFRAGVKVTAVHCPDFTPPSDEQLGALDGYLDQGGKILAQYSIRLTDVEEAYRKLLAASTPSVHFRPGLAGLQRFEAVAKDVREQRTKESVNNKGGQESHLKAGAVVFATDPHDDEAVAASGVLLRLMGQELFLRVSAGACCTADSCSGPEDIPFVRVLVEEAHSVVVLLSAGMLACPLQLVTVVTLMKMQGLRTVPDGAAAERPVQENWTTPLASGILGSIGSVGSLRPVSAHQPGETSKSESIPGFRAPAIVPVELPGFMFPRDDFYSASLPGLWHESYGASLEDAREHIQAFFRLIALPFSTSRADIILQAQASSILSSIEPESRTSRLAMGDLLSKKSQYEKELEEEEEEAKSEDEHYI